ncbi:E3 ubiquitin-protein ligase TRIM35-like isoform X1 [Osmerus eperlanus]|uniref:E3 ubiquitin-protein ligase TRIM35-like isoform X1 n=1 Tax=Osmerus eperlanus TaxID=29151 RepID=UPI002E0F5C5D
MAARAFLPEEDLTCPICCDIFKDPVLLPCCHSFCKACQEEWWRQTGSQSCPVCKKISSTANPPVNLALRNLSEAFSQEKSRIAVEGCDVLCSLHGEKLKLFCLEDKQPICVVCRDSRIHKKHDCVPINEAIQDHKVELLTVLDDLQCKLKLFHEVKLTCNKTAKHIPIQAQDTERKIKDNFKKLYQFLRNEEATRIDMLRKEAMQKSQRMKNEIAEVDREIASLSEMIKCISDEVKATHISFLKNFKATMDRASAKTTQHNPPKSSGSLINVANHLGNLPFTVWEKMRNIVTYSPIILDPNNAANYICLSEDLTSLSERHKQPYPVKPEGRSDGHVLGSEGFSSGSHSWEVEVGDSYYWSVGVATDNSTWVIMYTCDHYVEESTDKMGYTEIGIMYEIKPQRIRVVLDQNKGKLSFFDSDSNTHLHTILRPFTGKVFPIFLNGYGPMKILPMKICITVTQADKRRPALPK